MLTFIGPLAEGPGLPPISLRSRGTIPSISPGGSTAEWLWPRVTVEVAVSADLKFFAWVVGVHQPVTFPNAVLLVLKLQATAPAARILAIKRDKSTAIIVGLSFAHFSTPS